MLRYSMAITLESARLNSITIKTLVFPEWWLLAPLPFFLLLVMIEFCFRLQRLLAGARTRRHEATSVG
jgi:TRAP-type C4-dicarboxylate transport system permease small subunit